MDILLTYTFGTCTSDGILVRERVYVCVCVYMCVHVYILCVCACIYVCVCCVRVCVCVYIIYVCVSVCMYVCMIMKVQYEGVLCVSECEWLVWEVGYYQCVHVVKRATLQQEHNQEQAQIGSSQREHNQAHNIAFSLMKHLFPGLPWRYQVQQQMLTNVESSCVQTLEGVIIVAVVFKKKSFQQSQFTLYGAIHE